MPLRKGESFGAVMSDLKHGRHHKNRTRAQEIAIAYKVSGRDKKKRKRGRKKTHRMKSRR